MAETAVARKPRLFRRQHLVNRRYQGGFIALLCALTAFVAGVAGWRVYAGVHNALTAAMYRSHLPTGDVWQIIRPPLIWTNLYLAGGSFLLAVVTVTIILRKSSLLIRAIERETDAIDAEDAAPGLATEPLWEEKADKKARAGLSERLRPFSEAANRLETIAGHWEVALPKDAQAMAEELDGAIKLVEEGNRGFQC